MVSAHDVPRGVIQGVVEMDGTVDGKMAAMLVSLDKAGRVVIPKAVRDELDLSAGSVLSLEIEGDSIRMTRVGGTGRRLVFDEHGRPYFPAVPDQVTTDLDVQRLRETTQR